MAINSFPNSIPNKIESFLAPFISDFITFDPSCLATAPYKINSSLLITYALDEIGERQVPSKVLRKLLSAKASEYVLVSLMFRKILSKSASNLVFLLVVD